MVSTSDDVPTPIVLGVFGLIGVFALVMTRGAPDVAAPDDVQKARASAALVLDFDEEWRALKAAVGECRGGSKVTPAGYGMGRLYGCIDGREETAKLFINEDPKQPGSVLNVKVMWNEWKAHMPDAGADQREASRMARAVMKRYAAALEEDVLEAYWGVRGEIFEAEGLRFEYRWTPGPGIDEHLLTVTPGGQTHGN